MELLVYSVLLLLVGFYVGYLYCLGKEQIMLVDMFCTFLRVYGLTLKEIEKEEYNINELSVPYLLNRFKVFMGVAGNKKTLEQIKEDLRKEGR